MRIFKITGYERDYHTSRVAFSREEAIEIAKEMEAEEIYRWVNITNKVVHTPKQMSELNSYLASLGQ